MDKKYKMVIKIDIDGVLRDIVSTMCDLYNYYFDQHIKPDDITQYNINNFFPLIKEKYNVEPSVYFFDWHSENLFAKSNAFPYVKETINTWHQLGYCIIIASYQPSLKNKIDTITWLEENGIYYDDLYFGKDKEYVNSDILIDDNPDFISKETYCKRILVDQPYNTEYNDVYLRIDNLKDLKINWVENGEFSYYELYK